MCVMSLASHPPPGSPSALREANARRILDALRSAQRRGGPGLSQAQLARRTDLADIRTWAGHHGYDVS